MYDRRDLVHMHLAAQERGFGNYIAESPTFNKALQRYYAGMLDGLQRVFAFSPDQVDGALLMLFRATSESMLALRTPWSGFLEAGLIHRRLDQAGDDGARAVRAGDTIEALVADARAAHLEMLDALVAAMLGDRADRTCTDADLTALGVDVTEPDPGGYPRYDA